MSARAVLFLAAGLCAAVGHAQTLEIDAVRPGGTYKIGDIVTWRVRVVGERAAEFSRVRYVLKRDTLTEIGKGELVLTGGTAELTATLDRPGTVLAELSATAPDGTTVRNEAGAAVQPEKIAPSAPRPRDFDAFWKAKLAELKRVPIDPVLTPAESGVESIDYWKISLRNIRGTTVPGQLARPQGAKKLPALLIVQWAGVYPLAREWATGRAREGWLTLNINAHDLPIDRPAEFYAAQTALANYPAIGNEDRETSYFLRMYLSCYRALEYLTQRPDWDGKTLVVMGASQGGLQALMIGGLHPKITAVIANVPAGCDQTGPLLGRQPGWPMWPYQVQGRDAAKVQETARYYDVVNFAGRVRCPTLVSVGLIDTTCPPSGVIAAFNQLAGPKELLVLERSDHQGRGNTQAPFSTRSAAWLRALVRGERPTLPRRL
jgi:cephalosporin-C deacetylase-like acetyl esterase